MRQARNGNGNKTPTPEMISEAAAYYRANQESNKCKRDATAARKKVHTAMADMGLDTFDFDMAQGDGTDLPMVCFIGSSRTVSVIDAKKFLDAVGLEEFLKVASVTMGDAELVASKTIIAKCSRQASSTPSVQVKVRK